MDRNECVRSSGGSWCLIVGHHLLVNPTSVKTHSNRSVLLLDDGHRARKGGRFPLDDAHALHVADCLFHLRTEAENDRIRSLQEQCLVVHFDLMDVLVRAARYFVEDDLVGREHTVQLISLFPTQRCDYLSLLTQTG
jgi:hypothetical protein